MIPQDQVPDALARLVRLAAAAVPDTMADVGALRRRYRQRRRRRAAVTAGVAAACVGATAATAPLLTRPRPVDGPGPPLASSTGAPVQSPSPAPPPAQRLLFGWLWYEGNRVGELRPDGRLIHHRAVGVENLYDAVALPDGRLAFLGYSDLTPHVTEQPDGPCNPSVGVTLGVLRPDGSVELTRPGRAAICEYIPQLIGGAGEEVYLVRRQGVVAHHLASGAERLLVKTSLLPQADGEGSMHAAGGKLAISLHRNLTQAEAAAGITKPCEVFVHDLITGARLADLRASPSRCHGGVSQGLQVSPDGGHVAVVYYAEADDGSTEVRVAVLAVAGGPARVDRLLGSLSSMAGQRTDVVGLAWSDARTLRVASVTYPQSARPDTPDEAITVQEVTIS